MKRFFAPIFVVATFFVNNSIAIEPSYESLEFERLFSYANSWAKKAKALKHEEQQLLANVLYFSNKLSQTDLLLRDLVKKVLHMTQDITSRALDLQTQNISYEVGIKTIAALLKLSDNYLAEYELWQKSINYLDAIKSSSDLNALVQELQDNAEQEIRLFLENNKDYLNTTIEEIGSTFAAIEKAMRFSKNTFIALSQQNEKREGEVEAPFEQVIKVDTVAKVSNFIRQHMWSGIAASMHGCQTEQDIEKITQAVFALHYESLYQIQEAETKFFIIFNQDGLLPKQEWTKELPKNLRAQ